MQATTASTNVDVCLTIYNWASGALVATAAGCTDGSSTPALRNATVTFSTGTTETYAIFATNVLSLPGSYDLRVRNTTDDYPNSLASAFGAQPLAPSVSTNGVLNTASDADLFRYDRPAGATGAITFITSGPSPAPTVEVYFTTGTTIPSGAPIASGAGSVTISSPSVGHYWVRVVNAGAAGGSSYTVAASTTCGNCNENGTYASPRPLPTSAGGFVWNRIDTGSASEEAPNWTNCRLGTTCDWYDVTLAQNQRLTVTLYNVFDSLCDLEVAVYGPGQQTALNPADMNYFVGGFFDGTSWDWYPAVLDRKGSMESNGSQLTFVARIAGQHYIRVRGAHPSGYNCPRYEMGVAMGAIEPSAELPPPVH